jgi:uncharacterized membrane protein (DUF373 family)
MGKKVKKQRTLLIIAVVFSCLNLIWTLCLASIMISILCYNKYFEFFGYQHKFKDFIPSILFVLVLWIINVLIYVYYYKKRKQQKPIVQDSN